MFIREGGLVAAIFVVAGLYAASASAEDGVRRYSVTITNLTSGFLESKGEPTAQG